MEREVACCEGRKMVGEVEEEAREALWYSETG